MSNVAPEWLFKLLNTLNTRFFYVDQRGVTGELRAVIISFFFVVAFAAAFAVFLCGLACKIFHVFCRPVVTTWFLPLFLAS